MARVLALVPDMMDRSRVAAAAASAGRDLVVVREPAELAALLADGAALVLLDLGRPGVLEVLPSLGGARTVGFVSHVDRELIRRARAAGCGKVVARSVFFAGLADLFEEGPEGADRP
jgi:hypothetical protein